MKKLQATFNAVIVKPREEEESMYGSIIVPDLGKEKALIGTIVSIGEAKYHESKQEGWQCCFVCFIL